MKMLCFAVCISLIATSAFAMPVSPLNQVDDESVIMVRKGGGSYRSAKSGRFVTKSYGRSNKSTTVKHGKY